MKTIVTRKNGYTMTALANPKTKKLYHFVVSGNGYESRPENDILRAEDVFKFLSK